MRAAELLGRTAYDPAGRRLGRVVDVVVASGGRYDRLRLAGFVVANRWYGRLVDSDQPAVRRPWPIRMIGRLLRHGCRLVPVEQVRLRPPVPGFPQAPGRPEPAG